MRHAETPELAREALVDSAVLIYKSQIEVAFREQTAGHNALLLFVGLALQLMEEQLFNAFKELDAKEAEVRFYLAPFARSDLIRRNLQDASVVIDRWTQYRQSLKDIVSVPAQSLKRFRNKICLPCAGCLVGHGC